MVSAAGCSGADNGGEDVGTSSEALLGASLPGITAADFATVAANFAAAEEIGDGLGPVFNERACGNCHGNGALGGAGENIERRYGRFVNGGFDPLAGNGGSLQQLFSLGNFNNPNFHGGPRTNPTLCSVPVETTPAAATVRNVGRLTTPTFGLGLVEAMPDSFFDSLVAAEPAAIRGVVIRSAVVLANPDDPSETVGGMRVNRYGWKDAVPVLEQFAADAYVNEMGITTQSCVRGTSITAFCTESAPNGIPEPVGCDDTAPLQAASFPAATGCPINTDDAVGPCSAIAGGSKIQDDVANFATFMTFLAPPPRNNSDPTAATPGATVFNTVGCNGCHVTTTFTTPATTPGIRAADGVLRRVPGSFSFQPFSDFAAHDMGSLGDNIGLNPGDTAAQARRMRTAPLWGLHSRNHLLHDGRTSDVATAIRAHDGQGAAARNAFNALSAVNQHNLVQFVLSL
jgi:CxxC motif-containing protein (DUF1111 family)